MKPTASACGTCRRANVLEPIAAACCLPATELPPLPAGCVYRLFFGTGAPISAASPFEAERTLHPT